MQHLVKICMITEQQGWTVSFTAF